MIIILHPDANKNDTEYLKLLDYRGRLPNIPCRTHEEIGAQQILTEIYLIGDTSSIDAQEVGAFEIVERVVRRSEEHTSELQSRETISYAVFCLKKKNTNVRTNQDHQTLGPPQYAP